MDYLGRKGNNQLMEFRRWALLFPSLCLQALGINVQCSDLQETLSLIFCGADVNCPTGVADWPSPMSLATAHSQPLQAELLRHNLSTGRLCEPRRLRLCFFLNRLLPSRVAEVRGGDVHEHGALFSVTLRFSQWLPVQDWFHDSGYY